jgi:hypothetical protein
MMTVVVLAVLWLIVVVPMVVRRRDERSRNRSVVAFGRMMRALGRRPEPAENRPDVFVPSEQRVAPAAAARRPVPAAQEALMYPVDRSELSAARAQMMARRRRSLTILGGGTGLFLLLGLVVGGLLWLLTAGFALGLAGYLMFLRNQALRDRERRENRLQRAATRRQSGYDATDEFERYAPQRSADTVVRIDDDDLELQSMDTIDLTGVYSEEADAEPATVRRAS